MVIKVEVSDDERRPPGHALIRVEGIERSFEDLRFFIRRPAHAQYLSPGSDTGWSGECTWLTADTTERVADAIVLAVGPDVVRWMKGAFELGLLLDREGESLVTAARWPGQIRPPVDDATSRREIGGRDKKTGSSPQRAAGATVLPPRMETLAGQEESAPQRQRLDGSALGEESQDQRDRREEEQERLEEPSKRGFKPAWLAALALAVVAAGTGLLWQTSANRQTPPDGPAVVEDDGDPNVMFRKGKQLIGEPLHDATRLEKAFELLREAAKLNHPGACFEMGKIYDPRLRSDALAWPVPPSLDEARDWYERAARAGVPDAAKSMREFDAWVDREADGGDREAQEHRERRAPPDGGAPGAEGQ